MSDKLGILINTILNVKQEDLQKQLDSVSKNVKINLNPRIDFDENVIAKFKSDVDKLAKNIKLNLQFDVDKQSVKDAEKTVTETATKISEKSKSQNKIKVFNKEQLEAEGRQFFISATDIVNSVKNQFKELGDVNVNFLKNAKNQIVGFEAEIKKLDGTIEQLRFDMAKIKVGDSTKEGFVFSGANLIDKNIGDVLQRNLNTLQKFETRLRNIRDSFTSSRGVKEANNLAILNKEYNSILSTIEKLRKSQSNLTEEQKRNIDKQINTLNSLYKAYRDIEITAEKGFNFKQFKDVTGQIIQIRENFEAQVTTLNNYQEALSKPLLEGFKLIKLTSQETEKYLKVTQELQKGNEFVTYSAYVDKATNSIHEYSHSSHNAMIETLTLSKAIKTAIIRMGEWAIAGTLIFGTLKKIREGIQYIHELDDAIVDLTKVVDLSNQQINEMAQSAIDLGKKLGKSSIEIMKGMAEWGRFTKDINEIKELTRVATMASNVSDLSVQEASKLMTTAMIDYKLQVKDMMSLLDSFNEIQNNMRVSAKDLADAIAEVGNAAAQSETPIADLQGYIAAMVQSTGASGSEVGTTLKSAISRIYRLGSEGEDDAGKAEEQLNKIGVAVRDVYGNFRAFSDIINDVAKEWSRLNNVDQVAVAQAIGGTHHYSKIIGLFENFDLAIKAVTLSLNSEGSALRENEKYINSITGRIERLNTSWQDFTNSLLSSDLFKGVISLITAIVDGMNTIPGKIALIVSSVTLLTMAIATFKTQIVAAGIAVKGFFTSLGPIGWITLAVSALTPVVLGIANAFSEAKKSQEEFIQTTKQQIKELQQEASKLNEELKTTNNRINELNSKDKLTSIEENELSKLKLTNEELQKRIALLEKEQEIKEKELAKEAQKLYEKQFGKYDISQQQIDEYINNAMFGNSGILLMDAEESNVSALIAAYKQLLDLKKEALSFGDLEDVEYFDDLLTYIEEKLINNAKELQNIKDTLGSLKNPTERQKQILDEIEQALNLINEIVIPDKINENIKKNSDSFQEYEDNLKQLNDTIDSVQSDLKTLNQVLDDVQNGQSLNAETVLDLIQKHKELIPAIHKTADGWTIEKDAIENLRKAKIEEARVAIESQINSKEATLDNVYARVEAYGIEIEAIEDLKSAQQEASKLGFKKFIGEDAFENIKFDDSTNRITVGDKITEWSKEEYDKIKQSFNEQKLINDTILKIGELRERNKKLLELLSDPNFGVSSSKSSSSKSSSSKSTPFSEQFDFINTKIKLLNQELKELQQQLDDTFFPADKQTIIDKMIIAQQKKADLLKEAIKTYEDSAQKELQKIPESLRSAVVSGSFNIATISETTYGEERAKEISEAIKQYQSLTDTIIGLKNEYAEIDNTIRSLNLDKITLSFEIFDKKIRESDRALEELDYQLNLLKDNDYDKKAEILTKKIEVATKQVNEYEQELERLKAIVPANEEEAEKLQERIDELTKKFREGKISIKEYNDTFEETAKNLISTLLNTQKDIDKKNLENQLKEREKQIYDITEAEFEAYKKAKIESLKKQKEENEKFATEEAKELVRLLTEQIKLEESISYKDIVNFDDLYKEIHNEKIKQYQDTIDMLERSNELEQQRLEREERILEIQELQLKLQNTLNNRNVQILRKKEDGSWEYDYVADPEKVEELQKQIAEKQKDFDEWERNNSLMQTKKLLQQKIEQERELIRISEETYNKIAEIETTKFNEHYENMDILAENALEDLKTTYSNKWDEIIKVLQEKVRIAEQEYAKLLGASVAGVSGQNPNKSSTVQKPNTKITVQPPSTGFGTTPTAESEAYARQLKEAVGGDREAFRQIEIARTEQVIANRKAQGMDTSAQEAYLDSLLKNTFKFKEGGLVDFTGLAWVDGSKTKPEAFLNPTETKLIGKLADSLPNMANILNNFATTKMKLPSLSKISNDKEVKQIFNIGKLEFPNVRTADEIKAAILDLPRLSLQSAKAY